MYGDYSAIRRDYLVEDFRRDIGTLPVIRSVHVQAEHDPSDPLRETRWLQAVADAPGHGGFPHAIVAYADLAAAPAEVEALLAAHCASANVRGIRQMLHQALVPALGLPADYLADARWQRNVGLLARHDLAFDLQILPQQAELAARLAARHEAIRFVLVHAGQPRDRTHAGLYAWKRALAVLSKVPNVAIKISGLGMFDPGWTVATLRPIVLAAIDRFGPQRAMFGSNFPVDSLMRGYAPLWHAYDEITAGCSADERDALFYANAARVYRI
jgi:predicted TIM-barrel fold metal-dependent hydrolase